MRHRHERLSVMHNILLPTKEKSTRRYTDGLWLSFNISQHGLNVATWKQVAILFRVRAFAQMIFVN